MNTKNFDRWLLEKIPANATITEEDNRMFQAILAHLRQDVVGLPPYPVIYDLDYPPDADCDYIDREDYDALRAAAEGIARDAARWNWWRERWPMELLEILSAYYKDMDDKTIDEATDAARKATP